MARRGRVIGAALGLLVIFLFVTSRNSGSHPRDLQNSVRGPQDPLSPVIKEPAGAWDPVNDKFHDQQRPNVMGIGDMPGADEALNRKTPKKVGQDGKADTQKGLQDSGREAPRPDSGRVEDKKKGQDTGKAADMASNIKGQPDTQKPMQKPGEGSGAVVNGNGKGAGANEVEIEEYDPAAGSCDKESISL